MELTPAQQVKLELNRILHALRDIEEIATEMATHSDAEGLTELRTQLFKSRHLQAAILAN